MTSNDQHILMTRECAREMAETQKALEQLVAVFESNPGPRNDPHSKQYSMLVIELARSVQRTKVAADLLTRLLEIARPTAKPSVS